MSDQLSRNERAVLISRCVKLAEDVQQMLDVLLPEDAEPVCPHPADKVVDDSSMDDDGELYRCTLCGAESKTHFHSSGD
jgi:hypothetical protein